MYYEGVDFSSILIKAIWESFKICKKNIVEDHCKVHNFRVTNNENSPTRDERHLANDLVDETLTPRNTRIMHCK